MKKLTYKCCICGESIGKDPTQGHAFDPCAVVLVANWSRSAEQQREQQFFCHFECFRTVVERHDPGILDYIVDETDSE